MPRKSVPRVRPAGRHARTDARRAPVALPCKVTSLETTIRHATFDCSAALIVCCAVLRPVARVSCIRGRDGHLRRYRTVRAVLFGGRRRAGLRREHPDAGDDAGAEHDGHFGSLLDDGAVYGRAGCWDWPDSNPGGPADDLRSQRPELFDLRGCCAHPGLGRRDWRHCRVRTDGHRRAAVDHRLRQHRCRTDAGDRHRYRSRSPWCSEARPDPCWHGTWKGRRAPGFGLVSLPNPTWQRVRAEGHLRPAL